MIGFKCGEYVIFDYTSAALPISNAEEDCYHYQATLPSRKLLEQQGACLANQTRGRTYWLEKEGSSCYVGNQTAVSSVPCSTVHGVLCVRGKSLSGVPVDIHSWTFDYMSSLEEGG